MRQLGYPAIIIAEMLDGPSPAEVVEQRIKPLKFSSRFYIEVETAKELGLTVEQFEKLSRRERKIHFYFRYLSGKKEKFAMDDAEEERKRNQQRESFHNDGMRQKFRI